MYMYIHTTDTHLPILLGDAAEQAKIKQCNVPLCLAVFGREEEDVALCICRRVCVFVWVGKRERDVCV